MNSTAIILENIRQTFKQDPNPQEQLYSKILKSVFRYDTDQKPVSFASRAAIDAANKIDMPISGTDWHTQKKFDPTREIFHYEHCNPISVLVDRVLKSTENIEAILADNVVCWILKSEDKKLNEHGYKSNRPGGWKKCYHDCGIEPVRIN